MLASTEIRKLRVPLGRSIGDNNCCYDTFDVFTIALTTRDGLTGYGYGEKVYKGTFTKPVSWKTEMPDVATLRNDFAGTWAKLEGRSVEEVFADGSALDEVPDYMRAATRMALWDLRGLEAGKPVFELLGGPVESNRIFGYISPCGFPQETDWLVGFFQGHVRNGFKAIKVKVGHEDRNWDIERLRAIRDGVGPDIQIAVDGNTAWDGPTALKWMEAVQKVGINLNYVEDPLNPDDLEGYSLLAKESPLPIIGHDYIPVPENLRPLLDTGAIDRIRVRDGLDYALGVAKLAEEYDLRLIMCNTFCEHAVHFAVTNPRVERMEFADLGWNNLPANPVPVQDGHLSAPTAPGLGLAPAPDKWDGWAVMN